MSQLQAWIKHHLSFSDQQNNQWYIKDQIPIKNLTQGFSTQKKKIKIWKKNQVNYHLPKLIFVTTHKQWGFEDEIHSYMFKPNWKRDRGRTWKRNERKIDQLVF